MRPFHRRLAELGLDAVEGFGFARPVARLSIGPTLALPDAVAGKMSALWSRGEVRDFIDIDTVLREGVLTPDEVLEIGDSQEVLPMDRRMLAERFRGIALVGQLEFDVYAVDEERRAQIVERFRAWADEIDPDQA